MENIVLCKGGDCAKKESCYRYLADAFKDQDYFPTPPYRHAESEKSCQYYWYILEEKEVIWK